MVVFQEYHKSLFLCMVYHNADSYFPDLQTILQWHLCVVNINHLFYQMNHLLDFVKFNYLYTRFNNILVSRFFLYADMFL